ncbi:hypothetical protein WOLCODRAFT_53554, partial [Wolfiporia cocos MD-104 SS10]
PPEFSGDKSKITVHKWLQKCIMYFGAAKITEERRQIVEALQWLTGSAFDYQEVHIRNSADPTKDLGTWKEFEEQMTKVYGKKTDEEIARKEIEEYFGKSGKEKARADFYQYAERLRQLAKKAKTDNSTLMEKLKDVMPEKVRDAFALAKVFGNPLPTDWEDYLDKAISIHKEVYRDEIKGSIF